MEFKDITVCRTCFSDESSNNMVPLINKCEQKLTCYGLSLVKFTQIKISVFDNLPQFMCKMCLRQLNQSIQFKLRCESRNDTLNKLVKILQNEYTDKSRLQEEIVQHAMLLNSNILSPEQLSSSVDLVPKIQKSQTTVINHKNSVACMTLPKKASKMPIVLSNHDELLMTIESLYNSEDKPSGLTEDVSYCESIDDPNLYDNSSPNIEKVDKQLCRLKNSNIPSVVVEKKPVSQSLKKEETLVVIAKTLQKYPKRFSAEKPTKPKEYICKICNKVLLNRTLFNYHCQAHKNIYRFICEHCGKGFQFQTHLNLHTVALHETGDYIQCKKCPFKAARPFLLMEHERLHTGERPFACDKCGLRFRREAILKNHIKYHKEKTVQCPHCSKKFFNKWHLQSHINSSHERSYLYVCPVCDVKYASNKTVRRHLSDKHGIQRQMQGKITRIKL